MARMRKAQTAFSTLNKIWHWMIYSMQPKLLICNTNVKADLLYGCETWKNSKSITAKLQAFINKCLRKILRIFWPDQIMNKELWEHTKQPSIYLQIRKHKWGWLGHTLWKLSDNITRQVLERNPQGKQGKGRQETLRRTVPEEAKGVKRPGRRWKAMPRVEWDGGFLWKPYVPWRNDGICYYHSLIYIVIVLGCSCIFSFER
jgi:hypothetical protein